MDRETCVHQINRILVDRVLAQPLRENSMENEEASACLAVKNELFGGKNKVNAR